METSKRCKLVLCLIYSCLLFLSGALLVIYTVILTYKLIYHYKFVPSETLGPFILIFFLGILHTLLTWLGVKGPTREHIFHIVMFGIFTIILIVIEVSTGIWSMMLWDEVDLKSAEILTNSYQELIKNGRDKKDWIRLQDDLECCGITGVSEAQATCPVSYKDGCKLPLIRYVKGLVLQIALVSFIIGFLQVLGVIAFYKLYKAIKTEAVRPAVQRTGARLEEASSLNRQHSAPA